jgi:O-acetyl-ADP-ribose deacetylase (regulator of RNase III)
MLTRTALGSTRLELVQGDITEQNVDAIVNAANKALAGGAGVDGAIHRAGGPGIMEECRKIGRCPEGHAVITGGGNLAARYVIHTVGPIYSPGAYGQEKVLESAYHNSLRVAVDNGVGSIAFPSISTGAYRYPVYDAAITALNTVIRFVENEQHELNLVRFVLFDQGTLQAYGTSLEKLRSE